VEEQLRVGGELSAEVREGVSQEDDIDVGEEQRRIELEQRADEKRLCASHVREARRAPLGLIGSDGRLQREAARAGRREAAIRGLVGRAEQRAPAEAEEGEVLVPVESKIELRRVGKGDKGDAVRVRLRRLAHGSRR